MPKYFDIEVSLLGIEPRIWRRFIICPECTFMNLHCAIQKACGWQNSHLYEFLGGDRMAKVRAPAFTHGLKLKRIAKSEYAESFDEEEDAPNADDIDLQEYFPKHSKCFYIYDFGDYWEHLVELKQVVELPEKFVRRLLDGLRAFPPEDCGSTVGYEDCCRAISLSKEEIQQLDVSEREEVDNAKERLGDWNPEVFDLKKARREFDC